MNIRFNLDRAEERGIITREAKEKMLSFSKALYYPERDYERLLSAAEDELAKGVFGRLKQFLLEERRDLKREDAIAALQKIKDILNSDE